MMHLLRCARCFALAWIPALAGCGGGPNTPYPVRGVVVYEDGQPAKELAGGSVSFTPVANLGETVASGSIEEDGTFILSYKREGDGAIAGKHHVTIEQPLIEGEPDDPKLRRPKVALDPASTVQEVTVEPKSNDITLKVKRVAPRAR
jgi:hypothetical protein